MSNWSRMAPGGQHPVKHGLGFLFSGGLAFLIDASILTVLTLLGMHPIVARLFAISIAMVAGWLAHRRFTFRLSTPPRLRGVPALCGGRLDGRGASTTASSC